MRQLISLAVWFLLLPFFVVGQSDEIDFQLAVKEAQTTQDTLGLSRAYYKLGGRFYDQNQQIENSNSTLQKALFWAELSEKKQCDSSCFQLFSC